jgi:hypothetical protein
MIVLIREGLLYLSILMYIIINIPTGFYIDLNEYVHQSYIVEMIGGYATKDGEIF